MRKIIATLISVTVAPVLAIIEPVRSANVDQAAHLRQMQQHSATHLRQRAIQKRVSDARRRTTRHRKTQPVAARYVCPMHADIAEKAPGTCPKCLMSLEQVRASSKVQR